MKSETGTTLRRIALAMGGIVMLLAGCGRSEPALVPVQGQVFYRGQPLNGGTIAFTPDPERGGRGPLACAEIDAEGRYRLRTGENPGAAPGWHRVTIASLSSGRFGDLPACYRDPETSGQRVEIKAERGEPYHLFLE